MKNSLITASALALSMTAVSPLAAQESPEPMMDATEQPVPEQPMNEPVATDEAMPAESDAPPAAEAEMDAEADMTAETAETETNAPTQAQVAQFVSQGFPTYDADASGELNPDEFAAWLLALREDQANAPELDAQQASEWAGRAFAQADTDKSQQISEGELTAFLMG